MSLKKLISLLILISFSANAKESWRNYKLINGCKLYTLKGHLFRSFPGQICNFLNDGNIVSSSEEALRLITPASEVSWEIEGHFHHQVNMSNDRKRILALSSGIIKKPSGNLREDTFLIVGLDGKVIHQQTTSELYKQASVASINFPTNLTLKDQTSASVEISHFNSFYEIPEIKNKSVPSYIKEGNLILNSIESGIFIVTPDLKKVLAHIIVKNSFFNRIHDVQVNQKGNLVLFNNHARNPEDKNKFTGPIHTKNSYSSVQEIDPVTQKIIHEFSATPKSIFYSWICGSVQELDDDTWLFSHVINGAYIYSKSKKEMVAAIPGTNTDYDRFYPSQQIKAEDLTKFLSHWNQ